MNADQINGFYELIGGLLVLFNCRRIYKDRCLRGVSILPIIFFTSWGYWNLYFYQSVNCFLSFCGSVILACANTVWLALILYFRRNKQGMVRVIDEYETIGHKDAISQISGYAKR